MSNALQTVLTIKPATTDLGFRLGFVAFVRGPLRTHADAIDDLWIRVQAGLLRRRFTRCRVGAQPTWAPLPESSATASASDLFRLRDPLVGRWGLELAEPGDDNGMARSNLFLQISDLAPVRGLERASYFRVLFPDDTPPSTIAALGEWAIQRLPLWWGSAGFVFHHTTGTMFTAHQRMAALAKRYWAVQIQDLTSLQWDALRGMPSLNWLTVIGNDFAEANGMTVDAVAEPWPDEGVFIRTGPFGVAIAIRSGPTYGDINVGENLDPYVYGGERLRPLLLTEHTPLSGPFARPNVLAAWLARFSAPQGWLGCDISVK